MLAACAADLGVRVAAPSSESRPTVMSRGEGGVSGPCRTAAERRSRVSPPKALLHGAAHRGAADLRQRSPRPLLFVLAHQPKRASHRDSRRCSASADGLGFAAPARTQQSGLVFNRHYRPRLRPAFDRCRFGPSARIEMVQRRQAGESFRVIASALACSPTTVSGSRGRVQGLGHSVVIAVQDDHTRLVYAELHRSENAPNVSITLKRAASWFAEQGCGPVEAVMSDNAFAYTKGRSSPASSPSSAPGTSASALHAALERKDRALLRDPRRRMGARPRMAHSHARDRALSSFIRYFSRYRPTAPPTADHPS